MMIGADEYAELFTTGQYGQLYIVSGSHARGRTFRIYVLPPGEAALRRGSINGPGNPDAVEVYGITGGQPGWTETYGWLHRGPWQRAFADLVEKQKATRQADRDAARARKEAADAEKKAREEAVLASFVAPEPRP